MFPIAERKHPKIGAALIVLSIIMEILYIPCIISIRKHIANSCYLIMFYIGIIDLIEIPISGVVTGWMAVQGFVFCDHPTFIYIVGCFAFGLYCSVSMASIILALNRCIEMVSPKHTELIFADHLMKWWLILPTIYGFYAFMFTTPVKFTAVYMSWFFNPYVGAWEDKNNSYTNALQTFNNTMESGGLLSIYLIFCCFLALRTNSNKFSVLPQVAGNLTRYRSSQIRSFIQVMVISAVNVVACTVYIAMNHMELSQFLILCGTFGWLFIHGLPPVVYLTLNRTMRRDTLKLFNCCNREKRHQIGVDVSYIGTQSNPAARTSSTDNHNHNMF